MGCPPIVNLVQRTRELGETSEEPHREEHHSVRSLPASREQEMGSQREVNVRTRDREITRLNRAVDRKERIQCEIQSEKMKWSKLDDQLERALEATLKGDVDRKMETMTAVVYSACKDSFGVKEAKPQPTTPTPNRRENDIRQLRSDIKRLRKRFRTSLEEEKPAIAELTAVNREKLRSLRRAENHRRNRRERRRKRARFTSNPFRYVSKMLGDKRSGNLDKPKEEVEEYLRLTHSDPNRNDDLEENDTVMRPSDPSTPFDDSLLKFKEFQVALKKARVASSPGPNGIPYRVYKNCPKLQRRLFHMFKVI